MFRIEDFWGLGFQVKGFIGLYGNGGFGVSGWRIGFGLEVEGSAARVEVSRLSI